jgi:anaerobic ribonucleoside-triphosphate reductase activating protein
MSAELTFILEPDSGRVTVEASQAEGGIAQELKNDLGKGTNINCGRPKPAINFTQIEIPTKSSSETKLSDSNAVYLFRVYHFSTVDGPGRRSVIQLAGCSIRCAGCYVPETHDRANGTLTLTKFIIEEIKKHRESHDGVTILGGEPFDQPNNLENLVSILNEQGIHIVVYSGYTLESLIERKSPTVTRIL